jgi:predicted membrane channel-forming protein YqfA (hemolysin III family)
MKKNILFLISLIIMIILLIIMGVNYLFFAIPDWFVRVVGIFILIGLPLLSFSTIKHIINKKNKKN